MTTSSVLTDRKQLTQQVKAMAREAGFDLVGMAPLGPATHGEAFRAWLAAGKHQPMTQLEAGVDVRTDPRVRHPWARTVVALGTLYGASGVSEETAAARAELALLPQRPTTPPMPGCDGVDPDGWRHRDPEHQRQAREIMARSPALGVWPWIARFERDANYHRINDGRIERFISRLSATVGHLVRVQEVIEHSTFFERDLAFQAGLGWVGKNNLLINPALGSFFVLTSVFTDLDLEPDEAVTDHCLACHACLDACPTGALDGAYNLLVEQCLSARSISIGGPVPEAFVEAQAGHISGCDICQDACPFNRTHGGSARELGPAPDRWGAVTILDLMGCDDAERQMLFAGSLVARIPLETLHRNAILVGARILRVAAGALQQEAFDSIAAQVDPTDLPHLRAAIQAHLSASSTAIREAAQYALRW
jgi:epoxyqueuosine reductase QueG